MEGWLGMAIVLGGWAALQFWILPRLGVPT